MATLTDPGDVLSFNAKVESLDGVFGEIENDMTGHVVSNDRGMEKIVPLIEQLQERAPRGGVGLFIGSGGVTSLLPHMMTNTPVLVDRNQVVLDFTAGLSAEIIDQAPELEVLAHQDAVRNRVATRLGETLGWQVYRRANERGVDAIDQTLRTEAARFGGLHWSRPDRIEAAAQALRDTPPAYIAADLTHPGFLAAFAAVCEQDNRTITFANFTNVHEWIPRHDMQFTRALPFHQEATILYSCFQNPGDSLDIRVATSLEEYIAETAKTWAIYQDTNFVGM